MTAPQVLAIAMALLTSSSAASAQSPAALHPDHEVARWFAPILWPAVNEPTWPTIPHAAAFDGIDHDGDGAFDLDDVDEVRFGMSARTVEDLLREIDDVKLSPPRRVVYAGPRRFDGSGSDLLEYWFYYLYDRGPGSHQHDAEHAFLFLDVEDDAVPPGGLRRYRWQVNPATLLSPAVRIIVAAAHEGSTANNIIGATRNPRDSRKILPAELPTHVPLLAELGKHATAPDLHLDGRFDPGLDANFFRGSLWGLRDSLTSGLGEVGFMTFEPWQSFPRQPAPISVEASFFTDNSADFLATYRPYVTRLAAVERTHAYLLFPMADLERLYELLQADESLDDIRRKVTAFLLEHRSCFWGDSTPRWSGTIAADVLQVMRQWALAPPQHIRLWTHSDHVDPQKVFKLHLFPRVSIGGGAVWDAGYERLWKFTIEVSDIRWCSRSGWGGLLDFFCPGRMLTDSRLELAVASQGQGRGWPLQLGSMTWKKGRGNRSGVYLGMQWQKAELQPGHSFDEQKLREVSFESGVSIEDLRSRRGGSDWPPAVRTGVFFGHSLSFMRVELQAGIVVEPRGFVSDVDQNLGARPNLRFQFGTTASWNSPFWSPKPWK